MQKGFSFLSNKSKKKNFLKNLVKAKNLFSVCIPRYSYDVCFISVT